MLIKTVTYTDYNGTSRKEDFYFHLTKAELTMMNMSVAGTMQNRLQKMIDSNDGVNILTTFEDILHRSYGVKSEDGKRLIKNEQVWTEFKESPAYSEIFMELVTDSKAAADFVAAIMPEDLGNEVRKELKNGDVIPMSQRVSEATPADEQ